ncbi:MAG: hypothetical protein JWN34_643 [Bryobacterales bacterium]|nr:hypothetical protein [Bryobacterales bacterium]
MEDESQLRLGIMIESPKCVLTELRSGSTNPTAQGDAVSFSREAGFEPDVQQTLVLQSTARQGILNCTRQWGKSTTAAAKAAFMAASRPGSMIVVAGPSLKQSAELVRKAAGMLATTGVRTKGDRIHRVSVVLPNGSRIVGVPGNEGTVRGLSSVNLLLIDEAARVDGALYNALRPMVTVPQGDIWLMSTPWSTRGFFYEAWAHGGSAWERFSVLATECPRIPAAWLEAERRELGEDAFRREYMGEFTQDEASAFDAEVVAGALDKDVKPMDLGLAEFRRKLLRG